MSERLPDELAAAVARLWRDLLSLAPGVTGVIPYNELPDPPTAEPAVDRSLDSLAGFARPSFVTLEDRLAGALGPIGWKAVRAETLRSQARQEWLYGIGRNYKAAGRTGIVTNARAATGKHTKGEATDYSYVPLAPGTSPDAGALEAALKTVAASFEGDLVWGGDFVALPDPAHWEIAT